jgi:hypothetical protein
MFYATALYPGSGHQQRKADVKAGIELDASTDWKDTAYSALLE